MANVAIDFASSDPRKIASQNRQTIQQQGDVLNQQAQQQAATAAGARTGTEGYLSDIADPLAKGEGGYNADELSQIQMTPEQQQQMVTGAGISAGTGTAAAVGAAQRAANAAGGNPAALATYRARAAQTGAGEAGDAMTKARVAASDAAASRAENIGGARIGQQNTGLNYYQGLQNQQNTNEQNALNRQQQNYSTESGGINNAGNIGLQASQTPSTFDKVMGGIGGALSFLDEGDISSDTTPAVVGENGPEKVVTMEGGGMGMMGDGADIDADPSGIPEHVAVPMAPVAPVARPGFLQRAGTAIKQNFLHPQQQPPVGGTPGGAPVRQTPVSPSQSFGQGIGKVASLFLEDGGMSHMQDAGRPRQGANGIFTEPTRVNLDKNEAVVPLTYRAGAKVRPSMAALPAARTRASYGGYGGHV